MIDKPEPWEPQGLCGKEGVDPDLFFVGRAEHDMPPTENQAVAIKAAKRICNGAGPVITVVGHVASEDDDPPCPVRMQCLEKALRNREKFGVWGGMSHREREKYRAAMHGA